MATTITVNNTEEFENLIDSNDIRISTAFVETILKNLNSKKRHHHALSIRLLESDEIYDITIDSKDFLNSLEENIKIFESYEKYEDCIKIGEGIKTLKNKKPTRKNLARNK